MSKLALTLKFTGVGNLGGMLRGLAGASGAAQGKLRGLTDEARRQKVELAEVRAEMEKTSGNITQLLNRERALESQIEQTTRKVKLQREAMARTAKFQAMGQQASAKGAGNIATGIGMALPLIAAGKAAADFQDGMTDIQQKADLSAYATAQLQSNIIAAGRAAKQLPENMRAGVDALAGFGMSPQQASQMIAPIGKAATAYRAEIEDLSRASFAAVDNLKVPFTQTAKALDVMAQSGKEGAFEMKDMALYFPALTASMQGLKQTGVPAVADLAAALQITRKGAGDSATAANNLQNLLAKINTKDTIKNFKDFGVDLPAALKKAAKDGKSPIEAIAELTNKATGGDMSKLSFLFGDMQVQQALRPLIANIDEYRRIRESALKASGTVDRDFALRAQNANANGRAFMGNVSAIAINLSASLMPALVQVTDRINVLAGRFADWSARHPGQAAMLVKFVMAIVALNLALGAGRLTFGATIGPMVKLYNAFKWINGLGGMAGIAARAVPMIAGSFTAIGAAAVSFGQAMAAAGAFLLANPIILAIVALVAALAIAVPWIIKHWDAIKAGAAAFAGSLAQSFAPIIPPIMAVVTFLGGVWERIKGPLGAGLKFALAMFMSFTPLGWIMKGVMPALDWIKKIDWPGIGRNMVQGLIDGVLFMIGPLGRVFVKAAGAGIDAFKKKAEIHSPSRVFMGFGQNISEGLRLGIANTMNSPMRQAHALAAGVAAAAALSAGSPAAAQGPQGQMTLSPAAAAQSTKGPSQGATTLHFGDVHIHIPATPNATAAEIAAAVETALKKFMDDAKNKARSSFRDDDE